MIPVSHRMALAGMALLLASCGANTIRLDRAGTVASAGSVAVKSTGDFLAQVRDSHEEANMSIVASDPSCPWASSIILSGDERFARAMPNGQPVPLCQTKAVAAMGDVEIALKPLDVAQLQPTLANIDALAAYLAAVNAIVDEQGSDAGAKLSEAYAQSFGAQADLNTILGSKLALIPKLNADQQSAISKLATIIGNIIHEQQQVDALRALVARPENDVAPVITLLQAQVKLWGEVTLEGDLQKIDNVTGLAGLKLGATPPSATGFDERMRIIRGIEAHRKAVVRGRLVTASVIAALEQMKLAQADLVDGLNAHPNWSRAERAKAARINRDRILAALKSVAAVVAAFG